MSATVFVLATHRGWGENTTLEGVFSTLEGAKASRPDAAWVVDRGEWRASFPDRGEYAFIVQIELRP